MAVLPGHGARRTARHGAPQSPHGGTARRTLAGAAAWLLAARAARPLRRLQQAAGGLDPHTSAARLDHAPTRITEVDDLARTLQTFLTRYDEQAARTAEALASARSFSAAASHELRTPLMSMQTNLDILDAFQDLDAADRAETVDDLRHEHARLLGLLVMLRALAQGDLVEADSLPSSTWQSSPTRRSRTSGAGIPGPRWWSTAARG